MFGRQYLTISGHFYAGNYCKKSGGMVIYFHIAIFYFGFRTAYSQPFPLIKILIPFIS